MAPKYLSVERASCRKEKANKKTNTPKAAFFKGLQPNTVAPGHCHRRRQNSSSLSLFIFLETLPDSITLGSHNIPFSDSARNLGVILDSKLSMMKHVIKICQTAYFELKYISSIRRFLTEDATQTPNSGLRHTSQRKVPESGVRSVDATKPCYFIYISSHGLTTATVSSWVHLILSSNLYRKFITLLQDLFSWHPATTTQHLSWKNCTGFPFQNVLSIKSLVCVSVL